ncbi:MAG: hypothetical protein IPH60_01810 [Flavobacteriales bacterium]|jgi:hypothetical protein|nr:hypothetical protein [Flavobacteriales bacterium]MBP8876833.1 hypothetical protein [Flavobacteriales bacterium]
MKTPLAPLVPLITAITLGTTMSQELQVDGKFRVKGMSMEGARVIVERNGKQVQVLQDHIAHFTLNLDLQQDYVLHFIREGCLSKSLFFDTHIPEDTRVTASFRFPFLVTLEPKPKGPVVGYAKAVGTVIFDPVKGDFDYSTYYALEREKAKRRGPSDLQKTGLGAVTETDGTSEGSAHPGVSTTVAASGSTFERGPLSRSRPGIKSGGSAPPSPSGIAVVDPPMEPRRDDRTEEVEIRPAYVAWIVRITEKGHLREYRKVTHRYGEVHWFCNGASCSESLYRTLVSK